MEDRKNEEDQQRTIGVKVMTGKCRTTDLWRSECGKWRTGKWRTRFGPKSKPLTEVSPYCCLYPYL